MAAANIVRDYIFYVLQKNKVIIGNQQQLLLPAPTTECLLMRIMCNDCEAEMGAILKQEMITDADSLTSLAKCATYLHHAADAFLSVEVSLPTIVLVFTFAGTMINHLIEEKRCSSEAIVRIVSSLSAYMNCPHLGAVAEWIDSQGGWAVALENGFYRLP